MKWTTFNLRDYLQQIEKQKIEEALADSKGVVAEAARKLKVARTALCWRLTKLGIRNGKTS